MPRMETRKAACFSIGLMLLVGGPVVLLGGWILLSWFREISGPPYGSDGPSSGWAATWAGDVDGDGIPDLLLGTAFEPAPHATYGAVRVLSGSDGEVLFLESGDRVMARRAGDVNGDGREDVLLDGDRGMRVIDVASGGVLFTATPYSDLDSFRDPLGDVDGDGCGDLLFRFQSEVQRNRSTLSAISGTSGRVLWSVEGSEEVLGKRLTRPFGWNTCVIGDVDGDGVSEVAVDATRKSVHVLSGRTGDKLRELDLEVYWILGALLDGGDLDHDGAADVLVHEAEDKPIRAISCRYGRELWRIEPPHRPWYVTLSVVGDLDADGVRDLCADSSAGTWICSGRDGHRLPIRVDRWLAPGNVDANRDGHDDLLITRNVFGAAARELGDDVWRAGRVEVLSGVDQSALLRLDAEGLSQTPR